METPTFQTVWPSQPYTKRHHQAIGRSMHVK